MNAHRSSRPHGTLLPRPSTSAQPGTVHTLDQVAVPARAARVGLWLVPVYGTLHPARDPDPSAGSVDRLPRLERVRHGGPVLRQSRVSSIVGLGLGTLGVVVLGVLLPSGQRPKTAPTAMVAHLLGASGVFALFGLAAFAQPAMGRSFAGQTEARAWYDAVFTQPATLVPALVSLMIFSMAALTLGFALTAVPRVPWCAAIACGVSGPLIGALGVAVGLPDQRFGTPGRQQSGDRCPARIRASNGRRRRPKHRGAVTRPAVHPATKRRPARGLTDEPPGTTGATRPTRPCGLQFAPGQRPRESNHGPPNR